MESPENRLLKRATNPELPFAALPAIGELRRRLGALERAAVDSARAKGATWADIARAMGLTRQALQQRVNSWNRTAPGTEPVTEPRPGGSGESGRTPTGA